MSEFQRHILLAFGGRSPEHEVSVITALQAYHALKPGAGAGVGAAPVSRGSGAAPGTSSDLPILAFYVSKKGEWFTGKALLEIENYSDLEQLTKQLDRCTFEKDSVKGTSLVTLPGRGFFKKARRYAIDTVVLAFHGSDGENGVYQGLFESLDVPYTGSPVLGSAVGMDKVLAKKMASAIGVPVVPWVDVHEEDWIADPVELMGRAEGIGYPLILKPAHLGSSIGIRIVATSSDLHDAIEDTFRYDAHLLLEKRIDPLREINCSVRGDASHSKRAEASVCERPVGNNEFLSFQDKYLSDSGSGKGMSSAKRIIPADIPEEMSESIRQMSLKLFKEFGLSGLARFDFIVDGGTGEIYFNEVNTIPGSFSFYLWKEDGVTFNTLLRDLISLAKERLAQKQGRTSHFPTNLLSQSILHGTKSFGKK